MNLFDYGVFFGFGWGLFITTFIFSIRDLIGVNSELFVKYRGCLLVLFHALLTAFTVFLWSEGVF